MKRRILSVVLCLIIIFSTVFLCGCKKNYRFLNDTSEIHSIEIVTLGPPQDGDIIPQQTVVCKVEDISGFLQDFSKVDCFSQMPPSEVRELSTVIKITYNNGEYELIDSEGQSQFYDGYYYFYCGSYHLDEEQFQNLIKKYMNA